MSEETQNRRRPPGGPGGFGGEKLEKGELKKSLANLYSNGKKFLLPMIVALVLIAANVVLQIIAPQILKNITNAIYDGQAARNIDLTYVTKNCVILVIFYVIIILTSYFANFIMTTISQLYARDLRTSISKKINKIPLSYFDSHSYGDLLSRLTNDVDQIGQSLQQSISMLVQSIFMLLGVIIAMFVTSWQLALTVLISIPLMLIFYAFILKFAQPYFIKRQDKIGDLNGLVEENFSGQLIIKIFNADKKVNKEFTKENKELRSVMYKAQIFGGSMMPIMSLISYTVYAAVFIVGGLLMNNGGLVTFGTISAFLMYINLFQSPLSQIAQAINSLQSAAASSKRVFEFLLEKEIVSDENIERKLLNNSEIKGEIEFKNVSFSYNESREIIHNFSAKVKPGMKVAIVGPTGAGKTTMVNLLERFYEINSGDITIDGVSIKDMPRSEIRDIFGMVLQDTWVFEGSVKENIVYNTQNVTDEDLDEILNETKLKHYVSTLPGGINYVISDGNTISSGQKQLLTIARAMAKKAPLLILDEATSNVDTRTEEVIQEAMDKLTKGRTSFVIAHRLSTIKNADLILVMKDGNIIEQGNHQELMDQNGFYASLYNSQFAFE